MDREQRLAGLRRETPLIAHRMRQHDRLAGRHARIEAREARHDPLDTIADQGVVARHRHPVDRVRAAIVREQGGGQLGDDANLAAHLAAQGPEPAARARDHPHRVLAGDELWAGWLQVTISTP